MKTIEIKKYVQEWMDGHEPDTFVKNEHGVVIYSAGHSSLNLKAFFENLIEDFVSDNPLPVVKMQKEKSVFEMISDIRKILYDTAKKTPVTETGYCITTEFGKQAEAIVEYFEPFLSTPPSSEAKEITETPKRTEEHGEHCTDYFTACDNCIKKFLEYKRNNP